MPASSDSRNSSPHTFEAVTPVDIVRGHNYPLEMVSPPVTVPQTRSSSDTGASSLKSPRTARFAEATSVQSPVGHTENSKSPFADPPSQSESQHDVSDVGFGYVSANDPARHASHFRPPASPLKSALKTPGTARALNPLSPTFREEYFVEKHEQVAEKENARDVKVKLRVRIAKIFLRFVNFSCSLIVLSLLATTLTIFHTTKSLPTRNSKPAWAPGTNPWPQYLLLALSCVSLFACLLVFWGYWKGGHKRAEKVAVYYSIFSVCFFVFSLIMWVVAAALYQNSKSSGNDKDLWGWSCVHNDREQFFHDAVDYALVCRLQDWGLVCAIIEVVIEVLVILIYAVVFYRFYTKRRLAQSMNRRDKARSDLYLAQLRAQSAPNTPGYPRTPKPSYGPTSPPPQQDIYSAAENGEVTGSQTQYASPRSPTRPPAAFQLQPPPIRIQHATPRQGQEEFPGPGPSRGSNDHMAAAPGERTFDSVPIPGAYACPLTSPSFPPGTRQ